jgi:hypothetical protein
LLFAEIKIVVEGTPALTPYPAAEEREFDDLARTHCVELLSTFTRELRARFVTIECHRRRARGRRNSSRRNQPLGRAEPSWYDKELKKNVDCDEERESLEKVMRDVEKKIIRGTSAGT